MDMYAPRLFMKGLSEFTGPYPLVLYFSKKKNLPHEQYILHCDFSTQLTGPVLNPTFLT
jgi:hypothetical protein